MDRSKAFIIFLSILAVGLTAFFFISAGYYPVAIVGGDFVSAKRFLKNYSATTLSFENFSKTYALGEPAEKPVGALELQSVVLDQLVENAIVEQAARDEVGKDLEALVANKLGQVAGDPQLGEAARVLYGFTPGDFKDEVLVPQATTEVLRGRLFLKGTNWDTWIEARRKATSVFILSQKLYWDGSHVKASGNE